MRPGIATLLVPLFAGGGCLFDATVSTEGDANLECDDDANCPPQWRCVQAIARCVPADENVPIAPALSLGCAEDSFVDVGLARDGLVARIVDPPGRGAVVETDAPGVFRYTPALDDNGADTFTYSLDDGSVSAVPALVVVEVAAENDPPACEPLAIIGAEDDAIAEAVPCFDIDGDALTISLTVPPARGRVELGDGFLLYEPDADATGTDAFTLTVTDGAGGSVDLVVDVDVAAVNDAPVLRDLRLRSITQPGVPVVIPAPAIDVDGDVLVLELTQAPADGVAEIVPEGVRYTSSASAEGVVTFRVVARDGSGAASAPADVEVLVQSTRNCAVIVNTGGAVGDGVFTIDPAGTGGFDAYCDMTRFGGGWELAMKVDPSPGTEFPVWEPASSLWTDGALVRAASLDTSRVIAKLQPFVLSPFTELMVVAQTPDSDTAPVRALPARLDAPGGRTLREIFAAEDYVPTIATRAAWLDLVPGAALQLDCGREGLNVKNGAGGLQVRVGFMADGLVGCPSPDSAIGIGSVEFPVAGARCINSVDCATLVGAEPDGGIKSFMWLYVRDTDFTSFQPAPTCLAHAARGARLDGIYLVDDGGGPVPTRCDL